MTLQNVNVVGSPNTGGGTVSSSKYSWFIIDGSAIATNGDPVSSHPPCPTVPIHCSPDTASGHASWTVGGTPVNINGDGDTCSHTRNSSIDWFQIDSTF